MASLKTKRCRCCKGSGKELDHGSVGLAMLSLRRERKVSQADVARHMGYTGAFICDLEHGNRNWNQTLIDAYTEACHLISRKCN